MKNIMNCIGDYSNLEIGNTIGALGHHAFFSADKDVMSGIDEAARLIKQSGVEAFISREYPNPGAKTKNIIINKIGEKLFLTDGNRHCVALVIASSSITIGDLLRINPVLFRYWECGYETGGDPVWQPYVTYIPVGVDVSRVPDAKQGTDDKGDRINIIPSDIAYDSDVFRECDRGRPIFETARAIRDMIAGN